MTTSTATLTLNKKKNVKEVAERKPIPWGRIILKGLTILLVAFLFYSF